MDRLIMFIATGFGSGYLPKAPGTWGTLPALPLHYLLTLLPLPWHYTALGIIFVIAVLFSGSAEKILDRGDPGIVVIDEINGMLVALLFAPHNYLYWFLAFVVFRFFDIVKPFPIGFVDKRFHGGLGIVLDDFIAGLFTLGCMQLLYKFLPWFG